MISMRKCTGPRLTHSTSSGKVICVPLVTCFLDTKGVASHGGDGGNDEDSAAWTSGAELNQRRADARPTLGIAVGSGCQHQRPCKIPKCEVAAATSLL